MADMQEFLKVVSAVRQSPEGYLWASYDREADVVYVNFKVSSPATDSELTDEDVILRYEGEDLVGLTILHASQR